MLSGEFGKAVHFTKNAGRHEVSLAFEKVFIPL